MHSDNVVIVGNLHRRSVMSSRWAGGVGVDDEVEEEGELAESGGETSDDDYSPGSLVIDAKDEGTYVYIHVHVHVCNMTLCMYM